MEADPGAHGTRSGVFGGKRRCGIRRVIEELHYRHPKNLRIVENAYERLQDYPDEAALEQDVREMAERLENGLLKLIERERIDLIIPNNIWSLGWSLPAGIAFARAAQKTNIRFLCHHHDFYWERERYSRPTCRFVEECLERYFPPDRKNVEHVVINRIAKSELQKRKGIEASVVPNVFDFASPTWSEDEYNRDFREAIGVKPGRCHRVAGDSYCGAKGHRAGD